MFRNIGRRSSSLIRSRRVRKLFGNAYRYIEFAVTNQFYLIAVGRGSTTSAFCRAMKYNYPAPRTFRGPDMQRGVPDEGHDATDGLPATNHACNAAMPRHEGLPCTSSATSAAVTISTK